MPRLILGQDVFSVIFLLMSEIMPKKNSSSGLLIVAVLVAVVIIAVASLDDPVLAQTTTTLTSAVNSTWWVSLRSSMFLALRMFNVIRNISSLELTVTVTSFSSFLLSVLLALRVRP